MPEHPTSGASAIPAVSPTCRKRSGTTLVEALMAIAIFAVFVTGTCKLLVSHRQLLDLSRDRYTAANIAKNRMELVRTFDFDQIPKLNESTLRVDDSGIPDNAGHFRRTTTVTSVSSNLCELVVTVEIQNRKTLAFSGVDETVTTYVAKHL